MNLAELTSTANALVAQGKGILAADESSGTIKRRFDSIGAESTEETRITYRETLFRTAGSNQFISGVILYDETIRQNSLLEPTSLVSILANQGIIPGIKVDKGTGPLPGSSDELVTDGLDGLRDRLNEYYSLGARFTKWRAVITIGEELPSRYCIEVNAHLLARYASLSQEAGLVPIVEPEVLMDGTHSIDECFDVTETTLREVYHQLGLQRVFLEGSLLKPNMILSGKDAPNRAAPEEVAEKTIRCFQRTVPAAVPGIVFLSGGQSDNEATTNLNAINRLASTMRLPWELSFSYGRGLQAAPLQAWGGKSSNLEKAAAAYYHRAQVTGAARMGEYSKSMEIS
jgi:fructose-bisphosphate aldolase class I